MDVYRGQEHVATVNDFNDVKLGTKNIPFVRRGSQILHPDPVRDGLVLWFDFSGMHNSFSNRDVAEDLSGNGNHGELQNFNYTDESGYKDDGLKFDGVDDEISISGLQDIDEFSIFFTTKKLSGSHHSRPFNFSVSNTYFRIDGGESLRFYAQSNDGSQNYYGGDRSPVIFDSESEMDISIGVTVNKDQYRYYFNGEQVGGEYQLDAPIIPLSLESIGRWSSFYMTNPVYSVKYYNRPLTPEEIQHNYQIEKERFNL